MSSHFKYEIDERNLRLQLKENELSFSEEAWQKFESFTSTQKNNNSDAIIKRFHVSLNRNVVLPVVFAVVIIMFSLLLFNFINIKNPGKQSAEVAPQQTEAVITETENKNPVTPPSQAVSVTTDTQEPVTTETLNTQVTEQDVEKETAAVLNETPVVEKIKRERVESEATKTEVITNNTSNLNATPTEEAPVKKKRRNKREPIITEPTQEEAEQMPPPVSEETPQ